MECVKKVVAYGNSSYCVVIPKEYMDWMNIQPGDTVLIDVKEVKKS